MSSYVNFAVKSRDAAAVAATLKDLGRKGFVAPATDAHVVFYDEAADHLDAAQISAVGTAVSKALGRPVLAALNDDDERLQLWLFEAGALADSYTAAGDEAPSGGHAGKLVAAIGVEADAADVEAVLRAASDGAEGAGGDEEGDDEGDGDAFAFAMDRHVALAEALGLPADFVTLGFANVAADTTGDDIPERGRFLAVQ
jgi:hypothetical protein